MGDTTISWLFRPGTKPRSWNPTQGCEMVSPGCKNCYAMRLAARFAKDGWSQGLIDLKTKKWSREGRVATHKLHEPLTWRTPSTVFVNSMSDLFWIRFTNEKIAAIFGVMAACPQHVFIIVTKRARRMRDWFRWAAKSAVLDGNAGAWCIQHLDENHPGILDDRVFLGVPWPLPNVWLLVSVENQQMAEERIPDLLETPAVVRGLSCEPLLSQIDLTLHGSRVPDWDEDLKYDVLRGLTWTSPRQWAEERPPDRGDDPRIHWVITGCESGPLEEIRPAQTDWFRSLRRQCRESRVPFFFKQGNVNMEGITAAVGDIGRGGVAEPAELDGKYHQEFPG